MTISGYQTNEVNYYCTYELGSYNGLNSAEVKSITSIIMNACEYYANDIGDFASYIQTQVNDLYSCSCANVFIAVYDDYYESSFSIYVDWFIVVTTGDWTTVVSASNECSIQAGNSESQFFTIDGGDGAPLQYNHLKIPTSHLSSSSFQKQARSSLSLSSCSCSSFSWIQSSISSSSEELLRNAAIEACNDYPTDEYEFILDLQNRILQEGYYANIASTQSSYYWYDIYNSWIAGFEVGCYFVVTFANPNNCGPYKPPYASFSPSQSLSPSSSYIPKTNTPLPSISPSTSAIVGCGSPSCNGHGRCQNNQCICNNFYHGPQCQYAYCPGNCTYHGTCDGSTGECSCYYPYYGCDCSSVLYNCTCEHGTCNQLTGECACDQGWTGSSCNVSAACADNCNNHGRCNVNQTCDCFFGWTGDSCDIRDTNCTHGCKNGGYCNSNTGTCSCIYPYFGPECLYLHCGTGGTDLECSGHGKCNYQTGSCYCDVGYSGCFCTSYSGTGTPPPVRSPVALPSHLQCGTGGSNSTCSGHGSCNHSTGSCYCQPGWEGCYCNQYTGN